MATPASYAPNEAPDQQLIPAHAPVDTGPALQQVFQSYVPYRVNDKELTALKRHPGVVHALIVTDAGTGWEIDICDDRGQGDNIIFKWVTATGVGVFPLDLALTAGLTINSNYGTPGEATLSFL